ncbi:helix-turn-helix domain-containing protein [Pararhodobacter sp. SW119]|uniref:helix-turn-helix transcriptional regulator n=1 Tax=Pararhodobacter sp. SW119 TaxID=2780075 RepID=UPI001FD79B01|nr:helix-turn-helix domain-containing protein [Pararhodobacter sp. SW119]
MAVPHLDQFELAKRWKISHRTLERWRSAGSGPAYLKLGGRVLYRLVDVDAFELAQRRLQARALPGPAAAQVRRLTATPPAERRACR